MTSILLAIVVAAIAFIATNLENLFILIAHLNHPRYSVRVTAVGYAVATGVIVLASYGLSQLSRTMPTVTIHYLGILPISLGIWEFLKVVRSSHGESAALAVQSVEDRAWQRAIAIGLVTIASGGDSLVVFTSLFADTRYSADFVILATAAGMAILWVVLAQGLLGFPWLVRHLNRLGGYLLPFLLICVGVFILMDTPVDTM